MRYIISFFALVLVASSAFAAVSEKQKIDYLLDKISASSITFIRNGSEHTGKEASDHLRTKLSYVKGSITADDFITKIASKSSLTGTPYYVKLASGDKIPAEDWLKEQLKSYKP